LSLSVENRREGSDRFDLRNKAILCREEGTPLLRETKAFGLQGIVSFFGPQNGCGNFLLEGSAR
jgi:hypothetical protein